MHKYGKAILTVILACILMLTFPSDCMAESDTTGTSNYQIIIEDDADLLSAPEERQLAEAMEPITAYGNVAFKSILSNPGNTDSYAEDYYYHLFGRDSGTLFLIDMDNRMIYIHSDGAIYKTITKDYAETITDNVYKHASNADYHLCAAEAYSQIDTLLQGNKIRQPMKYISNALLSVLLAFFLCYAWICTITGLKRPDDEELMKDVTTRFNMQITAPPKMTGETRTYNPQSSGGGSGGSSGGGGRSGGGGGGGGHRF